MKRLSLVFVICLGLGCEISRPSYTGYVKIHKANGVSTAIEVSLPISCMVSNRRDAEALAEQLESTLEDLRTAMKQFPVDEAVDKSVP